VMKRPKPRKVAKYPELWHNIITYEMMVIYPNDQMELSTSHVGL